MTATTTQSKAARKFIRRMLGREIWLSYGTGEVEVRGYPLAAHADFAEVQRAADGEIVQVPYWSIVEMVEA